MKVLYRIRASDENFTELWKGEAEYINDKDGRINFVTHERSQDGDYCVCEIILAVKDRTAIDCNAETIILFKSKDKAQDRI